MNKKLVMLFCIFLTICITYQLCKKDIVVSENFNSNRSTDVFNSIDLMKNNIEIMPNNKFINLKNPGNDKVLVQDSTNSDKTYYKFTKDVKPNYNYKLTAWFANVDNWDGKDKMFNIKMYDKNNKIHPLSSNGNIISEKSVNGIDWKLTEYKFKVPNNFKNHIDILLGYKPKNTKGKRYFSQLNLKEYILDLIDFPNIDKLILYLDAGLKDSYNYHSSYNRIWTNKMNTKNQFHWEKSPEWNNQGFFKILNRKLTGPSPSKLNMNNNEFSIIIISSSLGRTENKNNPVALKIRGNQNVAFSINIPNDNDNITLDIGDKKYLVEQPILTKNKNIYTITYNNNKVNIYLDEALIKTIKGVPKVHFDKNNILINPHRDWNAQLYSILIYNKELNNSDIKFINSYFKKNILDNEINTKMNSQNNVKEHFETTSIEGNETFNEFLSDFDNQMSNFVCPEVNKDNGKYSFDTTNSKWAKSAGVEGKKFYDNRTKCMNEYKKMYENCEVPKILREPKKSAQHCIFTGIHTGNPTEHPCQLCPELDNYEYGTDVKISSDCKNSIKSYCYNQLLENTDIDKNCICFTPEYSKTPECQNFLLELHDNHIDYSAIKN